jgi:hypothetical protein
MTKELNLDVKQQEKLKQLLPSKKQQELPEGRDEKEKRTSQGKNG